MSRDPKTAAHCAIYTRKSSEEGLEQSFNSLDAQREACEAFILSQREGGWKALPARYDDGGYSGGTMERPALQRLLKDVEAKKVNVIVVNAPYSAFSWRRSSRICSRVPGIGHGSTAFSDC